MPIYGIVHLVYTAVFLIYFLLVNIIYPTKNFFRRFFKDLLFGAIKMETIFGFLLLTVGLFHWHPGVMVPIIVIASGFINDHESSDAVGVFTRYEVGKDWWVSETWSVGVAFTYGNLFVISDSYYNEKGTRHTISLLFRLTRG